MAEASPLLAGWHARFEAVRARLRCYLLARVIYRASRNYHDHRCLYMGAALSFFAALAVIPLVYTAVIVMARFVGSTDAAQAQLRGIMEQYLLPGSADPVLERVNVLLSRGGILGSGAWWSVLLLVWSGVRFYETLQSIFAAAWGWSRVRPFLHRQGVAVGAFIAAGALLGLATVLSVVASALGRMTETVAGLPVAPALIALADSLPFLLSIGVFLLVYKFIPPVDVPWRVAFVLGAGVAGAWELLRRVFTVFISSSGIYRDLYGPLSSLMLLLVWVYASATIILYGAELGAAWQRELALADEAKRDPYLPGMRVAAE